MDVSGTRNRSQATLALAMVAVVVAGCAGGPARSCRKSGGAELCLVKEGPSYKLTGQGFQGSSELRVSTQDDVQPPQAAPQDMPPVRVGADGAFPGPGGQFTVLRGPVPQRLVVGGTAEPVKAFETIGQDFFCVSFSMVGLLIHDEVGSRGGLGRRFPNRRGLAA